MEFYISVKQSVQHRIKQAMSFLRVSVTHLMNISRHFPNVPNGQTLEHV